MKDGEVTMCEVLDRIEARGVSRGIVQGKAEGRAEGKAEGRAQANERNMKIVGELLKHGRTDELLKMTQDSAYYDRVMRERFGD